MMDYPLPEAKSRLSKQFVLSSRQVSEPDKFNTGGFGMEPRGHSHYQGTGWGQTPLAELKRRKR